MQTANVMLAIAGDARNTVPKYGVTAAEVAVLRYIHGDDAVFDIDVLDEDVKRTHRQEIGRLTEDYGRQEGERRVSPAVAELYPGAAARVFETFAELELPDELYIAEKRQPAKRAAPKKEEPAPAADDDGLDDKTVNELKAYADANEIDLTGVTKKADILEAIRLHNANKADEQDEDDGDDGVETMPDENLFQ